jgi:hypothetical protein
VAAGETAKGRNLSKKACIVKKGRMRKMENQVACCFLVKKRQIGAICRIAIVALSREYQGMIDTRF